MRHESTEVTGSRVRIEYALPPARLEGREAIAQYLQNGSLTAVPDCSLDIRKETRGEDGTVTVEWAWKGTHTGEMPGWPPKGSRSSCTASACARWRAT